MAEMGEALRSCMERLVIAREEREQIIMEAANEISSEKKKVRELQQNLEDTNKKAARLAAENSHLSRAAVSKDALIGELRGSAAATGGKLADATARLEAAQKQAGSLQYEVRMLQKELEVRRQEREYDLKSADAARRQQAEHLNRIAQLEAECQRLRAMVRKRLPGPAAIAKMRDEVDQPQPTHQNSTASPRRTRPATPSSPRPAVVAPFSPRTPSPRRAVSDAEGYAFRLRAVEDESRAVKQALGKRESELQLMQMRYADEVCKLTVAQRQVKELTEENRQLRDASSQSESRASALISELEKFRSGNQNGGASVMASSEMNLLYDFAEIEKLEMASGDQKRNAEPASLQKADTGLVTKEENGNGPVLDGSVSDGHPEKVKHVWELVVQKQEASGESFETIVEQIRQALEQTAICAKRDDSDVLSDRSEIEKTVRNIVEEITPMIGTYAEDNVARSSMLLRNKSELLRHFEHLVQVCHELLEGKCKLGKFVDEVCLMLKYIVSQYFADQDHQTGTVNSNAENLDGAKSSSRVTANGTHDTESAKPAATLAIQTEAVEEPVQSVEREIMAHHLQPDTELIDVIQAQDDSILPGRKSAYREKESPAPEESVEYLSAHEESHLATNSEILAAADKLAECQETITILSKQLQALKMPAASGSLDTSSISIPRTSSSKSDYKPQSLASILAEEFADAEASTSPTTPKQQAPSKKDDGEVCATPMRSAALAHQEENAGAGADDKDPMQIVVHPVSAAELRQDDVVSADPKRKKKRGTSLLGRIMFRKRVDGGS